MSSAGLLSAWPKSESWWHCCSRRRSTLAGSSALSAWKATLSAICACKLGLYRAAEVNLTSQGTFSFADMTVCTLMPPDKRLYVPFTAWFPAHSNNFLWSSDFFCWQYTGCPKKCVPLPILSICFVTKTKITIWAESTIGISPFLFFSKVLLDSDNLFFRTATNTTLDNF